MADDQTTEKGCMTDVLGKLGRLLVRLDCRLFGHSGPLCFPPYGFICTRCGKSWDWH